MGDSGAASGWTGWDGLLRGSGKWKDAVVEETEPLSEQILMEVDMEVEMEMEERRNNVRAGYDDDGKRRLQLCGSTSKSTTKVQKKAGIILRLHTLTNIGPYHTGIDLAYIHLFFFFTAMLTHAVFIFFLDSVLLAHADSFFRFLRCIYLFSVCFRFYPLFWLFMSPFL